MKTPPVLIGAALLGLFTAPLSAAPYSAIYAFGDSLSDAGNAYIATGGATPPAPPYALVNGFGVFSNGPVWVQNLAGELGLGPLLPSLAGGTDFAFGGAQTESRGQKGMPPGRPLRSFDLCGLLRPPALAVDSPDPCDHEGPPGPARNRDYRPPRDTAVHHGCEVHTQQSPPGRL